MKKHYPIVLAFCALVSCATVPEPTFKDGVYTNPEFGFYVHFPEGWINSDPFPLFEEKIDAYNLQFFRDSFLHRCDDGRACYIVFYLLSPPDTIKMNYKAYRDVIDSLKVQ